MSATQEQAPARRRRRGRRGALRDAAKPLQFTEVTCEPLAEAGPRSLGLSYWYTPPETGDPYELTVKFVGRRRDGEPGDAASRSFEVFKTISPVLPGTGQATVTVRVNDVAEGRWEVTAVPGRPVDLSTQDVRTPRPGAVTPLVKASGQPAFGPLVRVRAPGTRVWAWPSLVMLGFLTALGLQQAFARSEGVGGGGLLLVTLVGAVLGLLGAKVYYLLTHPDQPRRLTTSGMSVQGFVLTFLAVLAAGTALTSLRLGQVLDVSAPPLLAGMAIGRLGCFFGGCCVGRPTASAWGLWCSDRSWGTRRIPVQLIESSTAAALFALSTVLLLSTSATGGLVFLVCVPAYVLARQLLFPLRDIPRSTRYGRVGVLAASAVTTVAAAVLLAVS